MNGFTVSIEEVASGIRFTSLDDLKNGLIAFSSGRSRGSRDTMDRLEAEAPDTALLMTMVKTIRPTRFVDNLLVDVEAGLLQRGIYTNHFDYDGEGPFFKTTVTATALAHGSYMLRLYAAYVGDAPEAGLAEMLSVERGIARMRVLLTVPEVPPGPVTIDFTEIARRLAAYTLDPATTGEAIAGALAAGTSEYGQLITKGGTYKVRARRDLLPAITVGIDPLTVASYSESPWTSDGSVLRLQAVNRSWVPGPVAPIVVFDIIGDHGTDRFGTRLPLFDLVQKAAVRTSADILEDMLSD